MATKIIFRKIAGKIVPIRAKKGYVKQMLRTDITKNTIFRKRLRQKASKIPVKKGKTGFYSEGGIYRGSSLIPRPKGGLLGIISSKLKSPGEIRFESKRAAIKYIKSLKKIKGKPFPF